MKGDRIEYAGNYGERYTEVPPIPVNPPTIIDRWGFAHLYLGDTNKELIRIAKPDKNGQVDIASLGHMRRDFFPELNSNN